MLFALPEILLDRIVGICAYEEATLVRYSSLLSLSLYIYRMALYTAVHHAK